MQRKLFSLACCLVLLAGSGQQADAQRLFSSQKPKYVEGKVRVKLQPEMAERMSKALLPTGASRMKAAYVKTGMSLMDRVGQQVKAVKMTRVFPYAGKDEARHKQAGLDLWYDITYTSTNMSPASVRNLYKTVPGVSYAQRVVNYSLDCGHPSTFIPVSADDIARAQKAAATMPFNAPLLPDQWHYHNDGSLPGSMAGADINVFPAWEQGNTGAKDVVVAIIDGGFQIDHPDLKDNLWVNQAELNGQPGVDDDGDGFVDDVYGYNFVINSSNLTSHNHGTHVAGGYDGTGGVKMMVCQVYDSNAGESADANFAGALVYAADRGASIAQCSWGSAEADYEDQSISEAVRYFTQYGGGERMNGGLCIFASGNTSSEGKFFPGCMPEVVAVGATTPMGTIATYTSHGTWVDVAAPGGYSEAGEKYEVLSTLPNSSYGYMEGTSMACPHVSGVAALILSKYGNKNFSNETLRTLLTTSVNRIYFESQDVANEFEGKCGSGVIDAYKALQGNESSVPGAVTDLTVIASHNYATLQWTIPESDEKAVDHHVVYYSKEPITDTTNLNSLNSQSFDTKYNNCGDKVEEEVEGLEAMTKYYFTVVAYNRWGKASKMSNVVEATTNEGPTAKLSTNTLALTVNAAKSGSATALFRVTNSGKGILKYSFAPATVSATMSQSATAKQPAPGRLTQFAGKVATQADTTKTYPVLSADYRAADYPDTLCYSTMLKAFIGENDVEMPNALAQYFYVDPKKYPNGFNLTDVYFLGQYGTNPAIEIYDGSRSISTASLITKVKYDEWNYNKYIPLEEQQFFAPGKSFWVVAKFAAGTQRPLGACIANKSGIQNYSFYSSDNGETWTQLSQVLKNSTYAAEADSMTWGVWAVSKNPNWSSVLNPNPASGEVEAGKSKLVKLQNDGQQLVNGKYVFNLHLNTNEAVKTDNKIAVTMSVSGYKPEMTSRQMVDYGSILVGQEKTYSVELRNNGFGTFAAKSGYFYNFDGTMTSSSDQFLTPASLQAIQARSSRTIDVTFKPTKAGSFSSAITLTDKNGQKHSFTVCGTAIDPAQLVTEKTEFDLGDLKVGDPAKEAVIKIKNEGNYPLQYVFPKYSDKTIEAMGKAHRYGYTYQTNIDGVNKLDYEPAPVLDDEVDITSQFSDRNWQSSAVPLGFKFPFYGKDYKEIYINALGGLQMQTTSHVSIGASVPSPYFVKQLGYISAFGNSGNPRAMWFTPDSKISYGHKDGKLYVIYKNVQVQGQKHGIAFMSMHLVLDAQGCVTIYYDDYDPKLMLDDGKLMYVGVTDIGSTDPMSITYHDLAIAGREFYKKIVTGSVIRLVAPGKSMITSLSSADGYVGIGETKEITVKAQANENLFAGALTNHLIMMTNDPKASSKVFTVNANITGDNFKADAMVDSAQIDFGTVFRTSAQRRTMRVLNNGTKDVTVSAFDIEGMQPLTTPISVNITIAPAMTFSEDSLVIDNVAKNFTGSKTVTLGNQKGKYQLEYSLVLDPAGNDVSLDDEFGGGGSNWGVMSLKSDIADMKALTASDSLRDVFRSYTFQPMAQGMRKAMAKARKDDAYIWDDPIPGNPRTPDAPAHTNALYYPVMQPISNAQVAMLGAGDSHVNDEFVAATRYTAPAEGFNLTHVFFVGTIGDLQNVDVEASVILGDNVALSKKTIGRGKLHINSEAEANGGHYGTPYTLKLDNPVYINPNDTFYVALKFPSGYPANMFMVSKDGEMDDNRFMGYFPNMGGWVDVEAMINASYSYGSFGYFMTALEEQPGKPWISLSADTKKADTLQVGETNDVTFDINAESAYFDRGNKATLVVRSNDPRKMVYNYHIYLNRNSAPAITAPKSTTTVAQGSTTAVKVSVADADGFAADADGIVVNKDASNAEFYVYDVAGQLLAHKTAHNLRAGDKIKLGSTLAAGVYVVIGNIDSETSSVKFTIK